MKRVLMNFATLAILIITIVMSVAYTKDFCYYGFLTVEAWHIEKIGNQQWYTTKTGSKQDVRFEESSGWGVNPELKKNYEDAISKKATIKEQSDIIQWVTDCSKTITGRIVRWVVLGVSIYAIFRCTICLIKVLLDDMRYLIKKFRM